VENLVSGHGNLATVLMAAVGGIGLLAAGIAPVITAVTGLGAAVAWLGLQSKKAALNMGSNGSFGAGGSGKGRGKSKGWRGKLKSLKGLKGKGGLIGAATIGALSIGATLTDSTKNTGQKLAGITEDAGAIGGGLGGAKIGAAIGTAIAPGVGTAIGGVLGAFAGSLGGSWLGSKLGSLFSDDETRPPSKAATAIAAAGPAGAYAAPVEQTHNDHSNYRYDITVNAAPGMNEPGLAQAVAGELEKRDRRIAKSKASRMYDPAYD